MDPSSTLSPSVSPDAVDPLAPEFVIGHDANGPVLSPIFTTGRGLLARMYEDSVKLAEAEAGIRQAGLTDPLTADRLRNGARRIMGNVAKSVESGLATLTAAEAQCAADIQAAIGTEESRSQVCANARAAEIRAWVRSLPTPSARTDALLAACREGEKEIVAACLAAPAALSGLDARSRDNLAATAAESFAPAATKMKASIAKLRGLIQTAADATDRRWAGMTGVGESAAAEAQRRLLAVEQAGQSGGAA